MHVTKLTVLLSTTIAIAVTPPNLHAQVGEHPELERTLATFVRGWRDGDADALASVLAMDEGRITWISGEGDGEVVQSMTFRAAVERGRTHPEYGANGFSVLLLDVIADELAMAKLEIPEGDRTNIDYLVCQRVAGEWRIVSNTFVVR